MLSEPDWGSSAADTTPEKLMIVEMRTYTLQPGTVAQFEERFGAALAVRAKLSPLAAFWHTEVGPLNRVIHVWAYDSFEERTRIRASHSSSPLRDRPGKRESVSPRLTLGVLPPALGCGPPNLRYETFHYPPNH